MYAKPNLLPSTNRRMVFPMFQRILFCVTNTFASGDQKAVDYRCDIANGTKGHTHDCRAYISKLAKRTNITQIVPDFSA